MSSIELVSTQDATQSTLSGNHNELVYKRLLTIPSDTLFPLFKTPKTLIKKPNWPFECQIINTKIRHIYYVPTVPEPFYVSSENESQPKLLKNTKRKIVYNYNATNLHSFQQQSNKEHFAIIPKESYCDHEYLRFESRFESGNLAKAVMVAPDRYELYLQSDLYTTMNRQWFYFRITNMKKFIVYRFSIVNISIKEHLYTTGMRPLMYSKKSALFNRTGWMRCGENISFSPNDMLYDDDTQTYTLTFTLEFPHSNDEIYLAYSYPYTYTNLQDYLRGLMNNSAVSSYTTIKRLCKSLAGNNVYCVTIDDYSSKETKKTIVVTARIHPGETPSSWMMKGFLDFITGNSLTAKQLRNKFIFKFIPMFNPDGVIVGNTCFSLTGRDFNKAFDTTIQQTYPPVWFTKLMVKRILNQGEVLMYCDLRAQNVTNNIYLRSCNGQNEKNLDIFKSLLSKYASDKFSVTNGAFANRKHLDSSPTMVMNMLGISNSFTLEASYSGSTLDVRSGTNFSILDYERMAVSFCQTLLQVYVYNVTELHQQSYSFLSIPKKKKLGLSRRFTESCIGTNSIKNYINDKQEKIETLILKSKTSQELFPTICKETLILQKPAWPPDCHLQFLPVRIKHMYYSPTKPEPFYKSNKKELQLQAHRGKHGKTVYENPPDLRRVRTRLSELELDERIVIKFQIQKPNKNISNSSDEDFLKFESKFESGNLAKAVKVRDYEYTLYLKNDLYTLKQSQWFYFQITNMKKNIEYRFSIVNMTKSEHLYNQGLQPLMYSNRSAIVERIGWRRCGENISYYRNDEHKSISDMTYTLSFALTFTHENDTVYLAYCYPYTYSDLQDCLCELCNNKIKATYSSVSILCKTLAGNNLYCITITSANKYSKRKKKAVVITARVHPAETPSSWMMKGIIDFLTGPASTAKELRDMFVFKLVPMLNPDGVIVGNTRYSLAGKDLNGQFKNDFINEFPTVCYTKLMIQKLIEKCEIALYCDLHAQYSLKNIFIYGCDKQFKPQTFPLLIQQKASDKFSIESCKYNSEKLKEGTARMTMWRMGISNSFTVEASFGGSSLGDRTNTHFSVKDYETMGQSVCQAILDFCTKKIFEAEEVKTNK
ncbi:hypothetical protein FQA39_LY02112 [Lamprigera yunnana]|nr:hypothetical protein FQA39_LY02112 [Lamprigera yunnana]